MTKSLFTAFAISFCIIASSFAGTADKIYSASKSKINIIANAVAEGLSKDLPKRIDKYTTFASVMFVSDTRTVIYSYQVTSNVSSGIMRPRLISTVCSNEILRALSSKGITFRYYYTNTSGSHLLTEDVRFRDCI